jgi:DNA polymerase III subunit delta
VETISIIKGIAAKNLKPAYIIGGPERFFADRIVERLKRIVLNHPMADLNLHELDGAATSGYAIINLAVQVPMMGSQILIVVENGHKLSAAEHKVLETYLTKPTPTTCLVLLGEVFDSRRGLTKLAKQKGWFIDASPLKESEIIPFLKWRSTVRKVEMTSGALAAISQAVGPDPAALDDAVERLGLYAGNGRAVEETDVAQVVSAIRQHSIFELVDAVGSGQSDRALSLLIGLLNHQQEPIMIGAMIARHFRQLLKTRIHMHLGTPEQALPGAVGAPPFMVKKLMAQARRFRGSTLEKALERLARADFELKSSKRPETLIIESAVVDLCPPK